MRKAKRLISAMMAVVMMLSLVPDNLVHATELDTTEQVTEAAAEPDIETESVTEEVTEPITEEPVEEVVEDSTTEESTEESATETVEDTEESTEDSLEEIVEEDENEPNIRVSVTNSGAGYLVNGIMAYAYGSSLSGEYELSEMKDNGTLAKALYYSYGSLGYSKCYKDIDQVYINYGATCDADKIALSKDILYKLMSGNQDNKTREFVTVIGTLPAYDVSVFTPYYLLNSNREVSGYTSTSKQGYSTPHNTIEEDEEADGESEDDLISLLDLEVIDEDIPLLGTSGGAFNNGYPSRSKFTQVDASKYGFPSTLADIPSSWLNLSTSDSSEKYMYKAKFKYTDLAESIATTVPFAGATANVYSCDSNKSLEGKSFNCFHCLTGDSDSAPDGGCDSESGSTTATNELVDFTVYLNFYAKYVDQSNHKVYIEYRTDYIPCDTSRKNTSVQSVGGGVWYTYQTDGYISVNKDGLVQYMPEIIPDANISNLTVTGIEYTIYDSDKKAVGVFSIASDNKGYVKDANGNITNVTIMKLTVGKKYYIKETSTVDGYAQDTTGGDGQGYYEFTVGASNTQSNPKVVNRVDEVTPYGFSFVKVSSDTSCVEGNPLYSLAGAEYVLNDTSGNPANFIVGFETVDSYGDTGQRIRKPIFANTATNRFITDENGYLTYTFAYDGAESNISSYYASYKKNGNTYTITFNDRVFAIKGSYRLSEVKASKGYRIDESCSYHANMFHGFTLSRENDFAAVTCTEVPYTDPIKLTMNKEDAETGEINPLGSSTLKGAIFEVDYYANHYSRSQLSGVTPTRKWYFETDENGKWTFDKSTPLNTGKYKSDAFYTDKKSGNRTIPLGTVTVKEIVAPEGYLTTWDPAWQGSISVGGTTITDKDFVLYQIKMKENNTSIALFLNGSTEVASASQTINNIAYDYVKRGDLSFVKFRYDNGTPMKHIAFILESMTTHEKHIIVTDEKGYATTTLEKKNVNANDKYLTDMSNVDQVNNKLKPTGIWFYGTADESKWDEKHIIPTRGALPYDTYTITELPSKNNEGTQLVAYGDYTFVIDSEGTKAVLPVSDMKIPKITSKSQDNDTKTHYTVAAKGSTITDTISYEYLRFDADYTLKGILVASRDCTTVAGVEYKAGQAILDDEGNYIRLNKSFHTEKSEGVLYNALASGTEELVYKFDSYSLMGVSAVWQTFLCEGKDEELVVVTDGVVDKAASHIISYNVADTVMYVEEADLGNVDEAVLFTGVDTEAWTTKANANVDTVSKHTVVNDTVYLSNLVEDNEYKLITTLVDPATGKTITANNGKPCEVTTYGVIYKENPETHNMQLDVTLPEFDSTPYAGKRVVVLEKVMWNNRVFAYDGNLEDIDESIYFATMGTTATDENGNKKLRKKKVITIVDKVAYKSLAPGKEYTVTGTLHYKDENGKVQTVCKKDGTPITASKTFTAEVPDGTVEVTFKFNMADVQGGLPTKIVVFEDVSYKGIKFLTHADIEDEDQTVEFPDIYIHTTAISEDTKDHVAGAYKTAKIIDTVAYEGLEKDKEYRLEGVLMDKATGKELLVDGKTVTATKTFTPDKGDKNGLCSGTEDMEFSFDAKGIKGKTVVVFEKLFTRDVDENGNETDEWIEVANHEELSDEGQSVHYTDLHTTASGENGEKEIKTSKKVTIIDKVSYTNLVVGKKYTVKGILMLAADKKKDGDSTTSDYAVSADTYSYDEQTGIYVDQNGNMCSALMIDGKPVTSEVTFVAQSADGTIDMKFTFDGSKLAKKSVVVFEDLYKDGVRIGTHADITDKGQTVKFKNRDTSISIRTDNKIDGHGHVKTGDIAFGFVLLMFFLAFFGALLLFAKNNKEKIEAILKHKDSTRKPHKLLKSKQKMFALFFAFLLGITTCASGIVFAKGEADIKKNVDVDGEHYDYVITKEYEADDVGTTCDFDEKYEGADRVNVIYSVEDAKYSNKTISTKETYKKLKEKDESLLKDTITKDGVEYHLTDVSWEETPITEEVSYTVEYGYMTYKPTPKETYHYTYKSPNLEEEVELDLPFKELKEGTASWVDGFKATATFKNIEGEEFTLGDHTFDYAENMSLTEGDYAELVKMLGYDTSLYRLNSFAWKGQPYEGAKDELWRDATLNGQQYATKYSAVYSDEVEIGTTYEAVGTYEGEIVDESSTPVYTIKATAFYQKEQGVWKTIAVFISTHKVGFSLLGILIIAGIAVGAFFVLKNKKNDKESN